MKKTKYRILIITLIITACSSIMTNQEFYSPVIEFLRNGNYASAADYIRNAEVEKQYADKDRLILFLDKGITLHYSRDYNESNLAFSEAEKIIDSLYTKSISKGIVSLLLNDNSLDYSGEVYEDLYINIFKALNYIHLNQFDEAYVEVNRISDKLKEQNVYLNETIAEFNSSNDTEIKIDEKDIDFYNDALANYISYLIFHAEGEYDNARISLSKLTNAWETYPNVYNYSLPIALIDSTNIPKTSLNVIAFTGNAPYKIPIGARITTFENWISITDPTQFYVDPIPFPGIEAGWNFKFEFPQIYEEGTSVYDIEIFVDGHFSGKMELLENIANVATKTFEVHKNVIFFKTIARAIAKGIASKKGGDALKKEVKDKALGDILAFALNLAVDATEHADLRSWQTIPGYTFISKIPILPGVHDIKVRFLDNNGNVLKTENFENYNVSDKLNLLETYYLD